MYGGGVIAQEEALQNNRRHPGARLCFRFFYYISRAVFLPTTVA